MQEEMDALKNDQAGDGMDKGTRLAAWIGKNAMESPIVNVPLPLPPLTWNAHPISYDPTMQMSAIRWPYQV